MYSQNNEEQIIERFFAGRGGKFLDIGAFDGMQMSNTRKLLELGWSGVLVEPSPENFLKLIENCRPFFDRVVLVNAAVSNETGLAPLYIEQKEGRKWSTTIDHRLVESGSVMEPLNANIFIKAIAPNELSKWGPYDFVSIDAEWRDFEILKVWPDSMVASGGLMCVEPRNNDERALMKEDRLSPRLRVANSNFHLRKTNPTARSAEVVPIPKELTPVICRILRRQIGSGLIGNMFSSGLFR